MAERDNNLQRLLDALATAIRVAPAATAGTSTFGDRLFTPLGEVGRPVGGAVASRLPVCGHLAAAMDVARDGPEPLPGLVDAFAAVEPCLAWQRRRGAEEVEGQFADNHANAVIVGAGGLEERDDVRVGVSLVAPGVVYPRHRHPPEELYVVLSAGRWRQNDEPWFARGSGELIHNPPNIWHAMRAGDVPLLAIWCLWMGR